MFSALHFAVICKCFTPPPPPPTDDLLGQNRLITFHPTPPPRDYVLGKTYNFDTTFFPPHGIHAFLYRTLSAKRPKSGIASLLPIDTTKLIQTQPETQNSLPATIHALCENPSSKYMAKIYRRIPQTLLCQPAC